MKETPVRTDIIDRLKKVEEKARKKKSYRPPTLRFVDPSPEARKKITECLRATS